MQVKLGNESSPKSVKQVPRMLGDTSRPSHASVAKKNVPNELKLQLQKESIQEISNRTH